MQFKGVMLVSAVFGVAALTANGCGPSKNNGDGGSDAPNDQVIMGKDVKTVDTGGMDAMCGVVACELCDVSGYSPPTMGSPIQNIGACTASEISAYVAACFAPGTSATCQAWYAADAGACTTCLTQTVDSATSWGAVTCSDSTHCGLNQAGCVDLILGTVSAEKVHNGAGSCGDLVNALFGCQSYDCDSCTATTDFQNCETNANTNECSTYFNPEQSTTGACALLQGDAAPATISDCFPQTTADLGNTVNVFCGTGQ